MKRAGMALAIIAVLLSAVFFSALAYDKLERGMSGTNVQNMQAALQSLGYSINADGKYGPATVQAVQAFQRQHGLAVDGVAENKTLTLLYSLAPAYAPQQNIPTGAPVYYPTATPAYSVSGTATVVTSGGALNIYEAATENARIIGAVPNRDMVIVIQRGESWSSVIYNGIAGYVVSAYLSFTGSPAWSAPTAATATPGRTGEPVSSPPAAKS